MVYVCDQYRLPITLFCNHLPQLPFEWMVLVLVANNDSSLPVPGQLSQFHGFSVAVGQRLLDPNVFIRRQAFSNIGGMKSRRCRDKYSFGTWMRSQGLG